MISLAKILCIASLSLSIGDKAENTELACLHMESVIEAAEKNNIEPSILLSLIHHESRWQPKAVSRSGACGLTQIIPKWTGSTKIGVPKLTCSELKEPKVAIDAGAIILSYWVHKYGRNNYTIGLCGYNAGFRCKGDTPSSKGLSYARRIQKTAKTLEHKVRKLKKRRHR